MGTPKEFARARGLAAGFLALSTMGGASAEGHANAVNCSSEGHEITLVTGSPSRINIEASSKNVVIFYAKGKQLGVQALENKVPAQKNTVAFISGDPNKPDSDIVVAEQGTQIFAPDGGVTIKTGIAPACKESSIEQAFAELKAENAGTVKRWDIGPYREKWYSVFKPVIRYRGKVK